MALRHAQNGSLGQTRISVAVRGAEIRLPPSPRASMRSCPGDTSACPHRRSWFLRPPVRSPLFDRDRQRRDQRRCRVHGGALAGIHHPAAGVHGKAAERPVHVLPSPDYLVSGTSWRFRRRRNSVTFPVEATRPAKVVDVDQSCADMASASWTPTARGSPGSIGVCSARSRSAAPRRSAGIAIAVSSVRSRPSPTTAAGIGIVPSV